MNVLRAIANWLSNRAAARELDILDAAGLRALAQDVGVSSDQLSRLAAQGPSAGEELSRFMRALGLAPERIERTHSGVVREMSIICSGCRTARQCRRDVDRGWAPIVQRYCPNADTVMALQAEKWQRPLRE